jgi:2-methylcitrate dehydratase PrpD
LRENFGTMTKPFQAGHAAESGMIAAQLADLGWTAAQNILEAQRGFFHAAGGSYDPAAIMHKLGVPWTFASPGVSLKPYPSGSLSHPAMTEMMRLIELHDIRPGQVKQVEVGANHDMYQALLRHDPKNGLEAKFSMEFCMAILLLERKGGLPQFTDAIVQRPDGRGGGLRQDDVAAQNHAERWQGDHGSGDLRQGQSRRPNDIRRGGREVSRLR